MRHDRVRAHAARSLTGAIPQPVRAAIGAQNRARKCRVQAPEQERPTAQVVAPCRTIGPHLRMGDRSPIVHCEQLIPLIAASDCVVSSRLGLTQERCAFGVLPL